MKCKYIAFPLIMVLHIFLTNCKTIKTNRETLFNIQDAYYQSWVAHKNEKGTDIIIQLTNVQQEIRFDSVVFRGTQIPAFTQEKV